MASRVNLVLEDEVKADLARLVPAGERSHFANQALRAQLALLKRQQAVSKLAALRTRGPHVSTAEVVEALRQSRDEP